MVGIVTWNLWFEPQLSSLVHNNLSTEKKRQKGNIDKGPFLTNAQVGCILVGKNKTIIFILRNIFWLLFDEDDLIGFSMRLLVKNKPILFLARFQRYFCSWRQPIYLFPPVLILAWLIGLDETQTNLTKCCFRWITKVQSFLFQICLNDAAYEFKFVLKLFRTDFFTRRDQTQASPVTSSVICATSTSDLRQRFDQLDSSSSISSMEGPSFKKSWTRGSSF